MAAVTACRSGVISLSSRSVVPSASSESRSASFALKTSFQGPSLSLSRAVSTKKAVAVTKASYQQDPSTEEVNEKAQKFLQDIKIRWDKVEDKPTFLLYTGASITAIYLASAVISAFEAVPLVPKLFQLVGIGYTSWFIYRYLLFTPNRQELYQKIDEVKAKIAGESKQLSGELTDARKTIANDTKPLSSKIDGAVKDAQAEFESARK